MPIITISRGTLSGGEALANRLSQKSGFPVLGLEVIKDTATHYGISESAISQQLKQGPSPKSSEFIKSLFPIAFK